MSASAARAEEPVAAALAALRSSSSVERAAAERTLAGALTLAHRDVLRAALHGADAEALLRVSNALGSRDEHLALAIELRIDADADLAQVGARALRVQIERWQTGLFDAPRRGREVYDQLEEWRGRFRWRPLALRAPLALEQRLDRLARLAPLPLGVALDPDVALRLTSTPREVDAAPELAFAAWDVVLKDVVARARIELQAPARWPAWGEPVQPFVVAVAGSAAAPRAPGERLVDWVVEVARNGPHERRAACARALAGSGWPAAVEWLAARWSERDDRAALSGALLAAGRGASPRAFETAESVRKLLALADAPPASVADPSAPAPDSIAHALAAGPVIGADGSDRIALLCAEFESAGPTGVWVRCVALEQLRGVRPEAAAACARYVEANPPASSGLREGSTLLEPRRQDRLMRQALRAAIALGGAAIDVARPQLLLASVDDRASALELALLLGAVRAGGAERVDPALLSGSARLALFAWRIARGEHEDAAKLLAGVATADAGEWLRELALEHPDAAPRRVLDAARALARDGAARDVATAAQIQDVALHAGLLDDAEEAECVARAIRERDLETLARACAGPAGSAARAALLDALAAHVAGDPLAASAEQRFDSPASTRLVRALGAALRELYAAEADLAPRAAAPPDPARGADAQAPQAPAARPSNGLLDASPAAFASAVEERLRSARKHPFAKALLESWPSLPAVDALDLDARERAW